MENFTNGLNFSPFNAGKLSRQDIASTIMAVTAIGILVYLLSQSAGLVGKISDFPECYSTSKLIVDGHGADGYSITKLAEEQHKTFSGMGNRVVPLFVPPQGLALISAIGTLEPNTATITWKVLLVGCLVIAISFLVVTFSLQYKQACYLVTALCLFYPCYEALRIDQLSTILLLSFSAAIYFLRKNKDIKAGLFLSLLLLLKPQYILHFLAYLAGLRRWRPLAVLAGMLILFTFIAFLEIGISGFQNYFALLRSPESIMCMQPELQPILRGQLLRLIPTYANIIFGTTTVIYTIVFVLSYLYGRHTINKSDVILRGVLTIMPVGLVTSLYCHDYDLMLLVPSLVVIFTDSILPFNSILKLILILVGCPFMIPIGIYNHYGYILQGGKINVLFLELATLALTIIYRMLHFSENVDSKAILK